MGNTSLFARKLRAYRTSAGAHGRLTQEALAERLGVSVEAVGKYERSLSYIRGDLESRLADRLGWNRADIVACREDWESRATPARRSGYRILDDESVVEAYGSWRAAAEASLDLAVTSFGDLPEGLAPDYDVFVPYYATYRANWRGILKGDTMVAKWALSFLLPEDETRFKAGKLEESDLSVDRVAQTILPGTYYAYCPVLIVRPGHEAASTLVLSSFVGFLEDLARRDVLLHGIGTVSVSRGGDQVCRDLGMDYLGAHQLDESYGIWDLPGAAVSSSIFGRRSPLVARAYREAFHASET